MSVTSGIDLRQQFLREKEEIEQAGYCRYDEAMLC